MRNKLLMVTMLISVISAGPVLAEEVIHFTNGTSLPIRSHVIEGDLVKIDLGDNGFMAFPKSVVLKIEDAPDVTLMPSTGPNKMFESRPSSSSKVYAMSPRTTPGNPWAKPATDATNRVAERSPTGLPLMKAVPGTGAGSNIRVIDFDKLNDTSRAARNAAGGGRVSLPNEQLKLPKTRRPLTAKD